MPLNPLKHEFISLDDLYVSYRKAKQESFFETSNISSIAFSEYEQNLDQNLENLHQKLISDSTSWWSNSAFLGNHLYIPKSLNEDKWANSEAVHFRSVDPSSDWENRFNDSKKKLDTEYRLIIDATVDYQIISALWILKVGHKFEDKLDNRLSFGNRLRRIGIRNTKGEYSYKPNHEAVGMFSPYFSAYQKWRENGLNTMKNLVEQGKEVTAITMDLASFYHNVSPKFLLRKSFLSAIDITLSSSEKVFTKQMICSMDSWYKSTPDYLRRPEGALPVGLSASKIISNVLLFELDKQLYDGLQPAYYGRYVDDLFLVFESDSSSRNGYQILADIRNKTQAITMSYHETNTPNLRLNFSYAKDSNLVFKSDKQKIFSLSSKHGLDLINQISDQIRAQSSEYRLLPEVPKSSRLMAEKALLASDDAAIVTDALRKADSVSLRRLSFSLLVRDIQLYTSNLSPNEWFDIREEFYGLVTRYLLTPKGIFDLFSFIPKIYKIIIENQDYSVANEFINNLNNCLQLIEKTTVIKGKNRIKLNLFKQFLFKSLLEASIKSSTSKSVNQFGELIESIRQLHDFAGVAHNHLSEDYLSSVCHRLLVSDLGTRTYKEYWYSNQNSEPSFSDYRYLDTEVIKRLRLDKIEEFLQSAAQEKAYWKAFAFPTRPLTVSEIALICPATLKDKELLSRSIAALRGAKVISNKDIGYDASTVFNVKIPETQKPSVHIALTNFEVTDAQFSGALESRPDRTLERYEKINNLINSILKSSKDVNYVVFPECSIPRKWALNIAKKLSQNNISLICGVEYYAYNKTKGTYRNDCLVSLTTNWPGYHSNFLFMQPKCLPAHAEQQYLEQLGQTLYTPKKQQEMLPVYKHGNFHFGVLICSDLTNPSNRLHFQGKLDTLFVLAWNKDINTFSFLVESAAHDIHTNVVQVNNRAYGDSRVRVPVNKAHQRDLVRLKGGVEDYFVIAQIDYRSLRQFHSSNEVTSSHFKPKPIGFKCSSSRLIKNN
ncbi:RNA-directed DNA polymerase [Aliivibrio logei]|uniref:RNA-directed DNA polymerase n=1 Tax=Aliivibrio logei TaxID=688 RepID=UPI0035C8BD3A